MSRIKTFPQSVAEAIQFYVYRLIDPRNGETFYVGKGRDNRVFQHIRAEKAIEDDAVANKVKRIREIKLAGFDVGHVIHRHGMDEKTALEVEAALLDAYPGLTNVAGGVGSSATGVMHADEILVRYLAEAASIKHRLLLINVNKTALREDLYTAVSFAWKVDPKRAHRAEYVLACRQGLIVGAFVAAEWLRAISKNFPTRDEEPDRYGFRGSPAPVEIERLYVGKRVPDEYRKRGAANPIRYTYR
ncbi:hypothetical protein IQ288_04835 [Burkholderia sp. R-69980]|nr:hypothetical protein [Burkholderia sp. R-69980]